MSQSFTRADGIIGPNSVTSGNLAVWDGPSGKILKDGGAPGNGGGTIFHKIVGGRLTPESANPIPLTGYTNANRVYYTPYISNQISLYNTGTSAWEVHTFANTTSVVPSTTNTMYDVFGYDNSGTFALEHVAWTNDTTRATALADQDGIYVKSGDASRRYLGSFRTNAATGNTSDEDNRRLIWNYYNRLPRRLKRVETTDWTYNGSAYRYANNSSSNRVEFVVGVEEEPVYTYLSIWSDGGASGPNPTPVAFGLDWTSGGAGGFLESDIAVPFYSNTSVAGPATAVFYDTVAEGYHYLAWLERDGSTTTINFYSNTSIGNGIGGILGYINA